MNTKLLSIAAAALVVSAAASPSAQAGMRVGFGFPLGAFVATQALNSMAQNSRRKKAQEHQMRRQQQAAAAKQRQQQAAAARAAASRQKAAAAAKKQSQMAAARKANAAETTQTPEVAAVTTNTKPDSNAAPAIYVPGPAAKGDATDTSTGQTEIAATTPATEVIEDDPNAALAADTEVAEPKTATAPAAEEKTETTTTAAATDGSKRECRKYFPTVGRLVTVLCE